MTAPRPNCRDKVWLQLLLMCGLGNINVDVTSNVKCVQTNNIILCFFLCRFHDEKRTFVTFFPWSFQQHEFLETMWMNLWWDLVCCYCLGVWWNWGCIYMATNFEDAGRVFKAVKRVWEKMCHCDMLKRLWVFEYGVELAFCTHFFHSLFC